MKIIFLNENNKYLYCVITHILPGRYSIFQALAGKDVSARLHGGRATQGAKAKSI